MGSSTDTSKTIAGNAIKTITLVNWAQTHRGHPLSLRLTRATPPPVVPVQAWRGEVLPNGPPKRPASRLPPPGTHELTVTVAEPLGTGRDGHHRVFAVDALRLTDPHDRTVRFLHPTAPVLPDLVFKVALVTEGKEEVGDEALKHEASMYNEMESLQGISIPRAYGLFTADIPPGTVLPSPFSSDAMPKRLSILVLERLGEALPLGHAIPEEGDLWDVLRDLARLGIELPSGIRFSDILHSPPSSPYTLPSQPCPFHHVVHSYRVLDFDRARKTDLTLKRHYFNTAGYLVPILDSAKSNVVLEPWEVKGNSNSADRPSAL